MEKYVTTVGLEIHAELKTRTKMFCNSKNDPDEKRPNVNICPVCMGYPGTLPVINKEAVKHILKMGLALGGEIADFTEFDRKNYFYPDIPKGYQLSQYQFPLVKGGTLSGVALTRIHLEEDTASSLHVTGDNLQLTTEDTKSKVNGKMSNVSLLDFNRAGVPLMELVTEPVIHSAKEASTFAKELQLLLQYLGAGEANMEKGEMRVEANISVAPINADTQRISADNSSAQISVKNQRASAFTHPRKSAVLGTKVEVKNLNSFKSVEKAIAYEVARHIELLESGGKVEQETRGWDEKKEVTFSQRAKEDSHDYRYFPDPDLPKLKMSEIPEFSKDALKKEIPELPWERRERYKKEFELKDGDVEIFVNDPAWAKYFEEVTEGFSSDKKRIQLAANYIGSDLLGLIKKEPEFWDKKPIPASEFSSLVGMIAEGKLSSRAGKDILMILYKEGGAPEKIAEEKGLLQKSDPAALKKVIEEVIAANPKVVADYKGGKAASFQFLIGQAMKATQGSANPKVVEELLKAFLS
jgi:aspartyl-tRNA(Asn)/glutamyl-tRNA(Gln) amidotransferase subunit B